MKFKFSREIKKNTEISSLLKIRPVGAELLYAYGRTDGQTDMTKITAAFPIFANAPKNRS
jgi:hypothetical protein